MMPTIPSRMMPAFTLRVCVMRLTLLMTLLVSLACEKSEKEGSYAAGDTEAQQGSAKDIASANDTQGAVREGVQSTGKLQVLDISERNKDGRNAIAVTFSSALDAAQDIQSYFSVSSGDVGLVDGGWVVDENNKIAWFDHTQPETQYEVTVNPGLPGKNGLRLKDGKSEVITTRRLGSSVSFDTQGAFLTDGKAGGLPVVSVNIDEVDIDFFRVKEDEIAAFINAISGNYRGYWGVDHLTRYAELVHTGRYALDNEENKRSERLIPIKETKALRAPGIYLAVMLPAGTYGRKEVVWFSVTDIGLHIRRYDERVDIYAHSLASGKPLKDVEIRVESPNTKLSSVTKTSADGMVSVSGAFGTGGFVTAQNDQHFSLVDLKKPALDLSEFDIGKRPQLPRELFIYAPRDLYRPGELVDFNALLRDGDGRETQTHPLNVEIKRPNGSVASAFTWLESKSGYFHHSWEIPHDAPVGNWELVVRNAPAAPNIFEFKVEEFLPERLKLIFNADEKAVQRKSALRFSNKQQVNVPVMAEYLYGAPAAGNRLSTMVRVALWRKPVEALPEFQFGDINETAHNQTFDLDDITLDDQGKGTLKIKSRWKSAASPLRVQLTSSVYESGGRPVSRSVSALVWPHTSMIGIRPEFGDKNPEAQSRVGFEIVNADAEGNLLAANNLDVQLIQEDRQYFWVYNESRGWHWDWSDKEFTVASQTLAIEAGKKARLEFPVEWGNYRLQIKNLDTNAQSSIRFYAGYNWYQNWQLAQQGAGAARPDRVTMALDKSKYRAGEVAKIKIVPPEAGEALVMVEGDRPLWSQRLSLKAEGSTLEIPIDEEWNTHNLYVTTLLLQPTAKGKKLTPKRSFGLVHLPLDREDRKLSISFDVPEKVQPNETLLAKVRLSGATATPGKQYLTLAAVDVGVLSISDFETPDPFAHFFGQRRYAVNAFDLYHKVIENTDAKRARMRFGGDADLARGGKEPQSEVQIVSLFSGLVEVDAKGEATVPLDIPDFNGRIRLMALGFSDQNFGSADTEVTVAASIVTQIAMPRFLAMGDKSTFSLDVQNMTDEERRLNISLSADGPIRIAAKNSVANKNAETETRSLRILPKQKITLRYSVEATGYSDAADIRLRVEESSDDASDKKIAAIEPFERGWKLGVRPAYPALISQQRTWLKAGETFSVTKDDLPDALPGTLEALLSVSTIPNMNIQAQLTQLIQYPYGCLEQTSSRAFPLTYASEENQARFNLKLVKNEKRIEMINKGIERLASMQLRSGGYGLWSDTSPEEHWLTAYVGDFLLSAQELGVTVPQSVVDKTMTRLKQYVNKGGRFVGERWSQNQQHYTFSYKAYAAYVLSRVNQAPLGSLRNLYDNKIDHAQSGLAQVQLGIALIKMGDKKRGLAAIDKGLNNFPDKRRYWGDYGSDIRDRAMVIHLLISNNVRKDRALELSMALADALRDRRWFSTQERTALFLAGIALEEGADEPWQATLTLGQEVNAADPIAIDTKRSYRMLLDHAQASEGFSLQSRHAKPLFVTSEMSAYSATAPSPRSEGMSIERQWYTVKGQPVKLGETEVGQLYLAHIRVSAESRVPDALVVDLLPAGFELENQNLAHGIKIDSLKIEGKSIAALQQRTQLKHQEYRDDRYVAALDVDQYRPADVFYLVRAVTPGVYKIPTPFVEDMYRPERHALGRTEKTLRVNNVVTAK